MVAVRIDLITQPAMCEGSMWLKCTLKNVFPFKDFEQLVQGQVRHRCPHDQHCCCGCLYTHDFEKGCRYIKNIIHKAPYHPQWTQLPIGDGDLECDNYRYLGFKSCSGDKTRVRALHQRDISIDKTFFES